MAMQAAIALEQRLGVEINPVDMVTLTLRQLCAMADEAGATDLSNSVDHSPPVLSLGSSADNLLPKTGDEPFKGANTGFFVLLRQVLIDAVQVQFKKLTIKLRK